MSESGPPGRPFAVPEEQVARPVFAALGGIVEIGAVVATGTWSVTAASVGDLVHGRGDEVRRLLDLVRDIGGFTPAAMGLADALGYLRDHPVTVEWLLLWSRGIEGVPDPVEELERPDVVRRMCRAGADLQLAELVQALVTAALVKAGGEADVRQDAERVAEVLAIAVRLVGQSTPAAAFRTWRVMFLPDIVRPGSNAPEAGKAGFRAFARVLDGVLEPDQAAGPVPLGAETGAVTPLRRSLRSSER
ncbi:hypothetical protein [Streptomyces sp. NPDC088812]|uniref:hypothetical protein n=1 Tax=Streptomyces sp. NPDC088812 TaxID=3365905 RepID=UPI0038265305